MSGIGTNLGKYLHPAKAVKTDEAEPIDNAAEDAAEPGVGSKLAGRLRPGMFKAKPKTAQEQSAADKQREADNAQNATRASLIGSRG